MAMEGFTGVIKKFEVDGNITLLPRCKVVQLSHLIFADDLMIFVKAVSDSVIASLGALDEFAFFSGLHINRPKSSIILGGLTQTSSMQLLELTGFKETKLPIRYLGVPLVAGKLTLGDCNPILDLIWKKLERWKSSFLSYARSYNRSHKFSKDAIYIGQEYFPFQEEGGLGLKRVKEMNVAGIMKQIWCIASHKKSIWVKWIYKRYMEKDIWSVKATSDASWVWRKILKYRDKMEYFIMHIVGNGISTNLWLDNWHPKGILIKIFGDRIRYDAGLSHLATIDEILKDGAWLCTLDTTLQLMETWGGLQSIPKPHYAE
ncbi:uncharacterized protein LOC122069885 [Macadamia integrifolia]|uniref:uncharacterized protein LOC122069885 n=1 Tax=Macadamia integrifolia TaxID=60698 RepID=UPI001C4FC9F0|nr:uncharacterized protein LOC122069885 [Macadamia integrifolia]